MKLLLDQNLSPRLAERLAVLFPGLTHVSAVGLARADDMEIWRFAKVHDFTIVTKDVDFCDLSVLYGSPPQIVWLRLGNLTTAEIEAVLRARADSINELEGNQHVGILMLF